jgi:hypothetical protein
MSSATGRSCILLKTHKFGIEEVELFRSLAPLEAVGYDVRFLADSDHVDSVDGFPVFFFCARDVYDRRWSTAKIAPYNAGDAARPLHDWFGYYALNLFYEKYPDYQFYWLIEYDIRLFRDIEFVIAYDRYPADFLSTRLISRPSNEFCARRSWERWDQHNLPTQQSTGCYFPINRFSNRAAKAVLDATNEAFHGYCEVFVPTLLKLKGFSLADFTDLDSLPIRNTLHKSKYDFRYASRAYGYWRNVWTRWRFSNREEV